jgi:hypothetical protein
MRATLHLVNREFEALADDFVTLGMLPKAEVGSMPACLPAPRVSMQPSSLQPALSGPHFPCIARLFPCLP